MKLSLHNAGFTLIELVVVMAIISVLVGVSASTFTTSRVKARDSRRKSELHQLLRSMDLYYSDYGVYPAAGVGNTIMGCGAGGAAQCTWGASWADNNNTIYMAELPKDIRQPDYQYQYFVSSDRKYFQAFAHLENDQDSDIVIYAGKTCGTAADATCNFGVSSPNIRPSDTLP